MFRERNIFLVEQRTNDGVLFVLVVQLYVLAGHRVRDWQRACMIGHLSEVVVLVPNMSRNARSVPFLLVTGYPRVFKNTCLHGGLLLLQLGAPTLLAIFSVGLGSHWKEKGRHMK